MFRQPSFDRLRANGVTRGRSHYCAQQRLRARRKPLHACHDCLFGPTRSGFASLRVKRLRIPMPMRPCRRRLPPRTPAPSALCQPRYRVLSEHAIHRNPVVAPLLRLAQRLARLSPKLAVHHIPRLTQTLFACAIGIRTVEQNPATCVARIQERFQTLVLVYLRRRHLVPTYKAQRRSMFVCRLYP